MKTRKSSDMKNSKIDKVDLEDSDYYLKMDQMRVNENDSQIRDNSDLDDEINDKYTFQM